MQHVRSSVSIALRGPDGTPTVATAGSHGVVDKNDESVSGLIGLFLHPVKGAADGPLGETATGLEATS